MRKTVDFVNDYISETNYNEVGLCELSNAIPLEIHTCNASVVTSKMSLLDQYWADTVKKMSDIGSAVKSHIS